MLAFPAVPDAFSPTSTPLAVGATADVFAYAPGWVLKLFHQNREASYADAERLAAHTAFEVTREVTGFKVPRVGESVRIADRSGLLYQRADGNTMQADVFKSHPYPIDQFAERLAALHGSIHALNIPAGQVSLPLQSDRLQYAIQSATGITATQRSSAMDALEKQPAASLRLCHGDFHMGNVLVNAGNETTIIDWHDASLGNPLADVARTSLLILFGANSNATDPEYPDGLTATEFEALRQRFNQVYLEKYLSLNPQPDWRSRLSRWLQIVATARLSESISPFERKRLEAFISA